MVAGADVGAGAGAVPSAVPVPGVRPRLSILEQIFIVRISSQYYTLLVRFPNNNTFYHRIIQYIASDIIREKMLLSN